MRLPNKDLPGKTYRLRTRCCGWCRGDRDLAKKGKHKRRLLKANYSKRQRLYLKKGVLD